MEGCVNHARLPVMFSPGYIRGERVYIRTVPIIYPCVTVFGPKYGQLTGANRIRTRIQKTDVHELLGRAE